MSGNIESRVLEPLAEIQGGLPGENILPLLKAAMIKEPVFQTMFGEEGERIFIDDLPSYNDTIMPLIEFWWKRDRYLNSDMPLESSIDGRIVLPVRLRNQIARLRLIASAFQRFLGANLHGLFEAVPGLTEFGYGMEFQMDQVLVASGGQYPVISFTVPVVIDLKLFQQKVPEVDLLGRLNADANGWVEAYRLKVSSDKPATLIPEGTLVETDQSNEE